MRGLLGAMWIATSTAAGKFAGNSRAIASTASTPPADAPITIARHRSARSSVSR
jgi:hypothetical protein